MTQSTMWLIAAGLFVLSAIVWFATGETALGLGFIAIAAAFSGISRGARDEPG